jgi:hypothetical protein
VRQDKRFVDVEAKQDQQQEAIETVMAQVGGNSSSRGHKGQHFSKFFSRLVPYSSALGF